MPGKKVKERKMQQREAFDSAPGPDCELCIVFMPALSLQERKGQRKSLWCENSGLLLTCGTMCEQNKAALDNSESKWTAKPKSCEHKLFFFFFFSCLDSSLRADKVNDPRLLCLHRSLFAAPDQCITFGKLQLPAAISSCWISLFWQCLREEHSVRCQVKTICDRFGGENQEKTNRQLNAWEMSQRSDRRR